VALTDCEEPTVLIRGVFDTRRSDEASMGCLPCSGRHRLATLLAVSRLPR
jgi:hypothetical protein